LQTLGRVPDQFGTDGVFDPLQFVVDGGQRYRDVNGLIYIGGVDRVVSAGDHQTHQVDRGGEEQFARVLLVRLPLEQLVQVARTQSVFEEGARAHDVASATAQQEFVRKTRTIAGMFQLVARERWLLNPLRNRLWFETISHKVLRLALPALHAALLVSTIALADAVAAVKSRVCAA